MIHCKRMAKLFVALVLTLLVVSGETKHANAAPEMWEMLTGSTGGIVFNTSAALSELVNGKKIGLVIKVLPGAGVSNPGAIGAGDAECGWIYPVYADAAVKGKYPFPKAYPELCTIVGGFSETICMFATLPNRGITDVKASLTSGKPIRILTNTASSATGWLMYRALEFYGTSVEQIEKAGGAVIFTGYSDWPQLVQDGHVDLIFNHSTLPSNTLQEIETSREIVVLKMPEDLATHFKKEYAYVDSIIPKDLHKGQTEDIKTVGTLSLLAVNKKVSDAAVTGLLDILADNEDRVRAIHPSWAHWSIANAWKNLGAPLHPAAEAWYVKKGLKK